MASPADGYKSLAGILSVSQMMEKRLANIEKALTKPGAAPVSAAAGGGGTDKYKESMSKTADLQLKTLQDIKKLLGGGGKDITSASDGGGLFGAAKGAFGAVEAAKLFKKVGAASGQVFIIFIQDFAKAISEIDGAELKKKGEGFALAASGIARVIVYLAMLKPLMGMANSAIPMMKKIVKGVSDALNEIDENAPKKAMAAAKAMLWLSLAILATVGALVLAGMIAMQAPDALMAGILAVAGAAAVFYLVGMASDKIQKGAKAMAFVGLSMIALAAGFYFFALGISEAGKIISKGAGNFIVGLIAGIGTITLLALIFYAAGEFAKEIALGALAFAAIGVSLIFLSFGLEKYFGVVAKIFGMSKGDGGGSVGGALAGIFGGIVTTVAGITLLLLVGSVFALAGLVELGVPFMIMYGALAFATIGIALLILTPGLEYYMNAAGRMLGIKSEGGGTQGLPDVFAGVATTIGGLGLLIGLGGTFALAGLAAPFIMAGAFALGAVGLALFSIGAGVEYYMRVAGDSTIGEELKTNLASIRDALLAFVGGENKDGGVFGAIKGAITGVATGGQLAVALASAMLIGPALTSIGQGIGSWSNLQQMPKIIGYDKMGQPIFDPSATVDAEKAMENIGEYLPSIVEPFIEISNRANLSQSPNLLSLLTGATLGESPFARGVAIAGRIGPVLTSLAAGIGSFNNVQQAPAFKGYDENGQPIYDTTKTVDLFQSMDNIKMAVEKVVEPFIDLANRANLGQGTSLLSLYTGINLSESPFSRGVSIAGNIGPVLTSLAGGIGAFNNVQQAPSFKGYDEKGQPIYDTTKTVDLFLSIDNIKETIEKMVEPFVELANNSALKKGTSLLSLIIGTDFGESPFARGVSVVGDIGAVLSSLAGGIGVFANLSQAPKITGYDELGNPIYSDSEVVDILASIGNITNVIDPNSSTSMIKPLIDLGNYLEDSKPFSVGGFLMKLVTGAATGQSPAEKGLAFALQIGRVLTEIGNGLGVFVNLNNIPEISSYDSEGKPVYSGKTVDSSKAIKNIGIVLKDIILTLSQNSEELENLEDSEDGAKAIGPMVGAMLNGISSSLESFASPNNIKTVIGYDKETGKAIYSAKGTNISKVIKTIKFVLNEMISAIASQADNLEKLEDAEAGANAVGKVLSSIASPIKKFAEVDGEAKSRGGLVKLSSGISHVISKLVGSLSSVEDSGSMESAVSAAKSLGEVAEIFNGDVIEFIENMVDTDMETFSKNSMLFMVNLEEFAKINTGDKKKRTFFAQFTDELEKLAHVEKPFAKFVKSFGQFAKDMGVFKDNFSVMQKDGIKAFESWSNAIYGLIEASKEGVAFNIVTQQVNKLMDTGYTRQGDAGQDDSKSEKDLKATGEVNKPIPTGTPTGANKNTPSGSDKGSNDIKQAASELNSAVSKLISWLDRQPSDKRLKDNIKEIGVSPLGISIYEFTYKMDPETLWVGVMAQDLIDTKWANALHIDDSGYYSVNYSLLDVKFCLAETYYQNENLQ